MDDKEIDKIITAAYLEKAAAYMPSEEFFASTAIRTMKARRKRQLARIWSAVASAGIAATLGIVLLTTHKEAQVSAMPAESFYSESVALAEERIEHVNSAQAELRASFDKQLPF